MARYLQQHFIYKQKKSHSFYINLYVGEEVFFLPTLEFEIIIFYYHNRPTDPYLFYHLPVEQ